MYVINTKNTIENKLQAIIITKDHKDISNKHELMIIINRIHNKYTIDENIIFVRYIMLTIIHIGSNAKNPSLIPLNSSYEINVI